MDKYNAVYIHTREHQQTMKRQEALTQVTTETDLDNNMLTKRGRSQRCTIIGFHLNKRSKEADLKWVGGCPGLEGS